MTSQLLLLFSFDFTRAFDVVSRFESKILQVPVKATHNSKARRFWKHSREYLPISLNRRIFSQIGRSHPHTFLLIIRKPPKLAFLSSTSEYSPTERSCKDVSPYKTVYWRKCMWVSSLPHINSYLWYSRFKKKTIFILDFYYQMNFSRWYNGDAYLKIN